MTLVEMAPNSVAYQNCFTCLWDGMRVLYQQLGDEG